MTKLFIYCNYSIQFQWFIVLVAVAVVNRKVSIASGTTPCTNCGTGLLTKISHMIWHMKMLSPCELFQFRVRSNNFTWSLRKIIFTYEPLLFDTCEKKCQTQISYVKLLNEHFHMWNVPTATWRFTCKIISVNFP